MNTRFTTLKRLGSLFLCLWLGAGIPRLQAQGPSIDPSFLSYGVAVGTYARQAVQQSSGKRVLLGDFVQSASTDRKLVRLLAGGNQPDAAFQANTAGLNANDVDRIIGLPNDQMLLFSSSNVLLTLGAVSRQGLLRLNADGTPDATFDTGSGPGLGLNDVVAQPDGKLLLAGYLSLFNGQPANRLIRLNANGALDATFQAAITGPGNGLQKMLLQPDGKILITGATLVQGQAVGLLARLLPTGALDTGFATAALPANLYVAGMAVQPDAKVLVAFGLNQGINTSTQPLIRLLADGSPDASFQTGTNFNGWFYGPVLPNQPVLVEPGGNIVVATTATAYNGQPIGTLVRLLPNGSLALSYPTLSSSGNFGAGLTSIQLLASGQLLTNYRLFNPDGSTDPSFAPRLKVPGALLALARQPDGKLLVGGSFTEISGIAAGGLARLNADGTPDVAFTTAAITDGNVYDIVVQPDGKLLVGGDFSLLGGVARPALGRLLATGQIDTGFAPTIQFQAALIPAPLVRTLAVQADGNVLAAGDFVFPSGTLGARRTVARLLGSTGQLDATFPDFPYFNTNQFLVQPDGKIVLVGQGDVGTVSTMMHRLLPNGTADPAFVITPSTATYEGVRAVQRDAAGRFYVGGRFAQFGSVPTSNVARLLPDGTPDPSFVADLGGLPTDVFSLVLQPNGRLLAGGSIRPVAGSTYGTIRLLANGTTDASYAAANGPSQIIFRLLVQPDGAIVAGGTFATVNGLPIVALTRLLDANVLSVANRQLAARTQAWPVPAHGTLHLALDAASQPQRVELLDALGRVVLAQPTTQAALSLDTSGLPPGAYMLRVQYATGPVARRVVLE